MFGEKLERFNQERNVTLSLRIQKGCLLTMYYIQNSMIERDAMNEQWEASDEDWKTDSGQK